MKRFLILILILVGCIGSSAGAAFKTTRQSLDFSLMVDLPRAGEMVFGYSNPLFTWENWLARKSSGPMLVPLTGPEMTLEVFEARSAGIVNKPISYFSRTQLHSLETVRRLDPGNIHNTVASDRFFTIETVIQFPPSWSKIIGFAKSIGQLAEKTTDKLVVTSEFKYVDLKANATSSAVESIIEKLNIYRAKPSVINFQGMVKINQIAKFGSMVSMFYELDAQRTLIVNYFAIGIKRRDLVKGVADIDVRSILMGENLLLNSNSGIGAGLPKYTESLFRSLYEQFDR